LTTAGLLTEYEGGFLEGWTDVVLTAEPSYGWCSFDESIADYGGELLDCFSRTESATKQQVLHKVSALRIEYSGFAEESVGLVGADRALFAQTLRERNTVWGVQEVPERALSRKILIEER